MKLTEHEQNAVDAYIRRNGVVIMAPHEEQVCSECDELKPCRHDPGFVPCPGCNVCLAHVIAVGSAGG